MIQFQFQIYGLESKLSLSVPEGLRFQFAPNEFSKTSDIQSF